MVDYAEKLFQKLADLGIIEQPPEKISTLADMTMTSCRVIALFLEYIMPREKEEKLFVPLEVSILEGECSLINTERVGQHLVIRSSWKRDEIVLESLDFSRLRSLTVSGEWWPCFISDRMRVLRVLDLEGTSNITNEDLKQIVEILPRLKFLSLRGCKVITRLASLGDLGLLQTLDIRETRVVKLPKSIMKLRKLQYIRGETMIWDYSAPDVSQSTAEKLPTPPIHEEAELQTPAPSAEDLPPSANIAEGELPRPACSAEEKLPPELNAESENTIPSTAEAEMSAPIPSSAAEQAPPAPIAETELAPKRGKELPPEISTGSEQALARAEEEQPPLTPTSSVAEKEPLAPNVESEHGLSAPNAETELPSEAPNVDEELPREHGAEAEQQALAPNSDAEQPPAAPTVEAGLPTSSTGEKAKEPLASSSQVEQLPPSVDEKLSPLAPSVEAEQQLSSSTAKAELPTPSHRVETELPPAPSAEIELPQPAPSAEKELPASAPNSEAELLTAPTGSRTCPMVHSWFSKLHKRRHVGASRAGIVVPVGIAKLRALHTLGVVNVNTAGGKTILENLEKLTQLRKLGLSGINRGNSWHLSSLVSHMESLSLHFQEGKHQLFPKCWRAKIPSVSTDDIQLPKKLRSLKLYGRVENMPRSIKDLQSLMKLSLEIITLEGEDIQVLGKLQKLHTLRLHVNNAPDSELQFCGSLFPKLQILDVANTNPLHVMFTEGALEKLELLEVRCSQAMMQVSGLKHLMSLKQVSLSGSYSDTLKEALQQQISEFPKKPVLKLDSN